MLEAIKTMFGFGPKVDFAEVLNKGAIILDVRTVGEFKGGHVKGSINIPLNELSSQMSKLKKTTPIIACCASGMRSSSATSLLKSNGFDEVYNGGSWIGLKHLVKN